MKVQENSEVRDSQESMEMTLANMTNNVENEFTRRVFLQKEVFKGKDVATKT